jgi:hypothetical protein
MFIATTLDSLPGVVGLHEGHTPGEPPEPRLPLINLQNRQAWYDDACAARTVSDLRNDQTLQKVAGDAAMLADVAFYNAPLMLSLANQHPDAKLLAIFRRCEGFVRSATIVKGEDLQPAGWPDPDKKLTDREKFIAFGRLQPAPGSEDADSWPEWSAIQRNIWLWTTINTHMLQVIEARPNCHALLYEDLVADPRKFWSEALEFLGLLTDENLEHCVARSDTRINNRKRYQVGAADTWSAAERAMYEQRARPLENRLYD